MAELGVVRRRYPHPPMNITELIDELQKHLREYGDIHVSGAIPSGNPEMTIHGISYASAGPLTSESHEDNHDQPERVVIEWKYIS